MHAVTYGVSRDQMMARHKSNHIQVAYADTAAEADLAMLAKAAMAEALGLEVFCAAPGTTSLGERRTPSVKIADTRKAGASRKSLPARVYFPACLT